MRELLVVNSTLGEIIRTAREGKGLSRTKLAEFADITPNSMVRYEKAGTPDGKYPSALKLVKICEVLEIDPRNAFDAIKSEAYLKDLEDNPPAEGELPYEDRFGFRFSDHFRTGDDWLNWKLSVKNVEELNDTLLEQTGEQHYMGQRLERIEKMLAGLTSDKQNGPDQNDPSRPEETSNNPEAVGAASTNQTEGSD